MRLLGRRSCVVSSLIFLISWICDSVFFWTYYVVCVDKTDNIYGLANNVKFHYNCIWFFLWSLAWHSNERFKRPAAVTKTGYSILIYSADNSHLDNDVFSLGIAGSFRIWFSVRYCWRKSDNFICKIAMIQHVSFFIVRNAFLRSAIFLISSSGCFELHRNLTENICVVLNSNAFDGLWA